MVFSSEFAKLHMASWVFSCILEPDEVVQYVILIQMFWKHRSVLCGWTILPRLYVVLQCVVDGGLQ